MSVKSALRSVTLFAVLFLAVGCSTVRQLQDPATLPGDGHATRTKDQGALAYSVATNIAAPPEVIWQLLTDGPAYTRWNSTVVKLEGQIAPGQKIKLVSKVAPDRTFELTVSEFVPAQRMIWEDGNSMFLGVRTFALTKNPDGTTHFGMAEVFSGGMLGMIEGSLPDFRPSFEAWAADLKRAAEGQASGAHARR